MTLVNSVPEVALLPPHPPVASHDVTLLLDHVSVLDPPEATLVGFAERETLGTGGGGAGVVNVALALWAVLFAASVLTTR